MNSLGLAIFFVAVAAASAGLHGLGPTVIAGPGGAVISSGVAHGGIVAGVPGFAGGALIAPAAAGAVIAPGLGGLLGHGLWAGSGIEGQYIPDNTELLYDDGSYKPHIYGH